MHFLDVLLHGVRIGRLTDLGGGTVEFRFFPSYWSMAPRPVLGQWFEGGGAAEAYRGPGNLPFFFEHLEPEASFARALRRAHGAGTDPLALLRLAGLDLLGAVSLVTDEGVERALVEVVAPQGLSHALPGVQDKMSAVRDRTGRLTVPVRGHYGDAILKLPPNATLRDLSENECATMAWARRAGFDVAPAVVVAPEEILHMVPGAKRPALLVARYDRSPSGPIHQEDLAQAFGLAPFQKYPVDPGTRDGTVASERRNASTRMETVVRWARAAGLGEEAVRRSVLVIATGNGDAHLKNWSLLYTDRVTPKWSPLYDQVSTIAYGDSTLALPLFGKRNFAAVQTSDMIRLGELAGLGASGAEALVVQTLTSLARTWQSGRGFPPHHAALLRAHWAKKVPALRPFAPLL